ncbi:hypothetical protein PY092_06600 [Muricauda sp. 334s03]|uniref:Threonine synthase n=1 Tax=Flagellimonas yonaguniensis TaxID=3031325 RepID=A0ABT5XXE7_9FLAO|nr:DUF6503 family protein [[Muricauda] yonaguniensis]MDF0715810.1 hypothetical protein [[Muricauda] yonaguniensis]
MNKLTFLLLFFGLIGCKQNSKPAKIKEPVQQEISENKAVYPDALMKVFDAHGGIKQWKKQRTLSFVLPKPKLAETHTIELWSRMDKIETEQFTMGFDGNETWLLDTDETYKGDVRFYHNLMFYFYAMPFVFADDGIMYSEADDLEYEGKNYPGIKVAFESGVGASSKDEYYIHFDPESHKMAWLGYTVTYRSGETSDNVRWINYKDWQEVNGLLLPKSITWHNYEGRKILEPASTMTFEDVIISENPQPEEFYAKPENGEYVAIKTN